MRLPIPVPVDHITASQFIKSIEGLDHAAREAEAFKVLSEGHVPSYMRDTKEISISFRSSDGYGHVLDVDVLPNYLMIGTDDDHMYMPLWPITAQRLCDQFDCMLPTTRLVDIIFNVASKFEPMPWGAPFDESMQSTDRFVAHNARLHAQSKAVVGFDQTRLTAGHKKDIVITNRLALQPRQVAIYGWHQLNGRPIQPLYLGHVNTYSDYSHGVRLIARDCVIDDVPARLDDILSDENMCTGVSSEGKMTILRQP